MAYQAKYWNGSAWVAVANASFDTSGLVKTTGNTGTVDLSGASVVKGAGMDLIVPTSVTGGTFSASGAISFSAATAVNVNGCFTSSYENYRVMLNVSAPTTGNSYITGRLRVAGTDASGANYSLGYSGSSTVGFQGNYTTGNTSFSIKGDGALETPMGVSFDVTSPASATQTGVIGPTTFGTLAGNNGMISNLQRHNLATAYDGLSLLSALSMTGTIRIYGYHN